MTLFLKSLLQSRSVSSFLPNKAGKFITKSTVFIQTRNYAARKGYRQKREKAKVKKEVVKKEFVPHSVLKKESLVGLL